MRIGSFFNLTIGALSASLVALPAMADVTDRTASPANRIIDVSGEDWQPEGFINGITVPAVHLPAAEMTLDGKDSEPEWSSAQEVTVALTFGNVSEARIKALYTNDDVFIRVSWPDATEDREHHPWVWDPDQGKYVEGLQVEDSVLLSFEAGCEWTPSILGGYIYDFDAWHWMAARSDPLGQAVDLYGNVQDRDLASLGFVPFKSRVMENDWILKFTENEAPDLHAGWNKLDRVYMLQQVTQGLYVKAVPDGGRNSPPFAERLPAPDLAPETAAKILPQYRPLPLTDSAGEVAAKGHWQDGYWTVEFRRARVTPVKHIFDTVFNRTVQFSVHVFEGVERIDEVSESPRLFLQFLPEETPLIAKD